MSTRTAKSATVDLPELTPAQWHAAKGVVAKAADAVRDELAPGRYEVDYKLRVQGHVDVAEDIECAASEAPNTVHLIAALLEKLDEPTRERILNDLPQRFEKAGCELPKVKQATLDRAEKMLERLRSKVTRTRRGAVKAMVKLTLLER